LLRCNNKLAKSCEELIVFDVHTSKVLLVKD
jgi:hypothetical protein